MKLNVLLSLVLFCGVAQAKRALTLQEAISDAEQALDNGRVGDAISTAERLQKSRGLTKDEQGRVELIVARCKLVEGKYDLSEKLFAKHFKASPDDTRLGEWYARALDGAGKGEAAFALLTDLAKKRRAVRGRQLLGAGAAGAQEGRERAGARACQAGAGEADRAAVR